MLRRGIRVIHHIDGNPYNNDPSNLRYLDLPFKFELKKEVNEMKIEVGKTYVDNINMRHEIVYYNKLHKFFVTSVGECFNETLTNVERTCIKLIEEWKEPKSGVVYLKMFTDHRDEVAYAWVDKPSKNEKLLACVRVEWKEGQFDD